LKEGEKVIDALTTVNLDTLKFSRNVGEESDELSLNATVEIKAYVYNEETVKKTIFKKLEPQVPKGYKLSIDTIEYDFNNVKAESIEVEDEDEEQKITKTVSFTLVADANVVKKIDKEKMRSDLAGKFMDDVNFILKDEYEVKDYKIEEESQYLFIFSRWMPFFKQNIEIKTKN
jgi:hypothetical protein